MSMQPNIICVVPENNNNTQTPMSWPLSVARCPLTMHILNIKNEKKKNAKINEWIPVRKKKIKIKTSDRKEEETTQHTIVVLPWNHEAKFRSS